MGKFIALLESSSRTNVILGSIAATCGLSGFFWAVMAGRGLFDWCNFEKKYLYTIYMYFFPIGERAPTLNADWKAGNYHIELCAMLF